MSEQPIRTPEEALLNLDKAISLLTLNRQQHIKLIEDINLISNFIESHKNCTVNAPE